MAKKEFTYRGMNLHELEKLSIAQLAEIFPSEIRRKIKRGFTEQEQTMLHKLQKKGTIKTHCRDMIILPIMVGKTIKLHNGKEFVDIIVTEEMIGHYLGEFSQTRRVVKHGNAGIAAAAGKTNKT